MRRLFLPIAAAVLAAVSATSAFAQQATVYAVAQPTLGSRYEAAPSSEESPADRERVRDVRFRAVHRALDSPDDPAARVRHEVTRGLEQRGCRNGHRP